MKPLKISVSGIRGVASETLTPELVVKFAQAFGTYLDGGKVIIGRDTRVSGDMVRYAVLSGLISTGCEVLDLGIVPTPTIQLMVEKFGARAGVAITASHNSADWNALIFIRADGMFLNGYQGEELLDIYHEEDFIKATWDKLKPAQTDYETPSRIHLDTILNFFDKELIKKKKLRVALDSCNGAASVITQQLLKELGCEVVAINVEPNGLFPREPEPVSVNLTQFCSMIKSSKLPIDIGFAQDADGDRLAIVNEKGEPIGEEYTLVLATEYWLSRREKGTVVTNLSTTRAIDDVAKKYSVSVVRTRVGDVNVTETLKNGGGVIGGEGNGGVVIPKIHYAQDSLAAMTLILQYLAETDEQLSVLVGRLPYYKIVKKKIECPPEKVHVILAEIREMYKNEEMDLMDGIKVKWDDCWLHIRGSGTEPIIRVIAEAKSERRAENLADTILRQIRKYL